MPKPEIYGILMIDILEEMEAIAKAIRPITYKKTFRSLEVVFVYKETLSYQLQCNR